MQRLKTKKEKEVSELLLPRLKQIQKEKGWLSEEDLKHLSLEIGIHVTNIYEVATFYSFLTTKKKGKHIIRVCNSSSCYVNGSENILKIFEKLLGIKPGGTTEDKKFTLEKTSCIGCCDNPPSCLIDDKAYTNLNENKIKEIIKKCK